MKLYLLTNTANRNQRQFYEKYLIKILLNVDICDIMMHDILVIIVIARTVSLMTEIVEEKLSNLSGFPELPRFVYLC